ncbi:hypothetical protein F4779DRAFT_619197 [Xylariaceae sp. FL0662B]|nr:hypothetical protein F4779DRAFT_619197 [Xylariaceae sp. FL0662B]
MHIEGELAEKIGMKDVYREQATLTTGNFVKLHELLWFSDHHEYVHDENRMDDGNLLNSHCFPSARLEELCKPKYSKYGEPELELKFRRSSEHIMPGKISYNLGLPPLDTHPILFWLTNFISPLGLPAKKRTELEQQQEYQRSHSLGLRIQAPRRRHVSSTKPTELKPMLSGEDSRRNFENGNRIIRSNTQPNKNAMSKATGDGAPSLPAPPRSPEGIAPLQDLIALRASDRSVGYQDALRPQYLDLDAWRRHISACIPAYLRSLSDLTNFACPHPELPVVCRSEAELWLYLADIHRVHESAIKERKSHLEDRQGAGIVYRPTRSRGYEANYRKIMHPFPSDLKRGLTTYSETPLTAFSMSALTCINDDDDLWDRRAYYASIDTALSLLEGDSADAVDFAKPSGFTIYRPTAVDLGLAL